LSSSVSLVYVIFLVTDSDTLQAMSMPESRRSWEGCYMTVVASMRSQKLRTKGRAIRSAKEASAGRGSLTVLPRNASGKYDSGASLYGGVPAGLNLKLYKGYNDGHCRTDTLDTTQEYHHT
jgi:hypothetical protein